MKLKQSVSLLSLLWLAMTTHGQKICLKDHQHQTPIVNANYRYGNQSGISDQEGIIHITVDNNKPLKLSHINYGEHIMDAIQLKSCLESGVFYWQKKPYEIQTVSIIALKKNNNDSLSIQLNNQNRLAHDAAHILSQVPEIALIRKSGNYGFDPVLRGFKFDQLNIIMDGVQSANAACPNRMDPPSSQMPINMISQIDIIKGPYALRFGNAIGGTINFKTTPPKFTNTNTFMGRISGSYESNGKVYRSETLVGWSGLRYNINFFGAISDGNDYHDGDDNQIPSSFNRNNFGGLMHLKLGHNQTIGLKVSHNNAKDIDFAALSMDLRSDDTWLGSINHTLDVKNKNLTKWHTSIHASYVDHTMDNLSKTLDPRMVNAETLANTLNYGARSEGSWQFKSNRLFAGLDYRSESADGERYRDFLMGPNTGKTAIDNVWQNAYINKSAIFGSFTQHTKGWQFDYAGRFEYNIADARQPDPYFESLYDNLNTSRLNPSISIGATHHLTNRLSMELWLAHAQRSGSLSERFINFLPVGTDPYEMLGNPMLSAEVNNQIDFNLMYKQAATKIRLSAFSAFLKNYISSEIRDDINPKLPSSPGVRQYINIDNAHQVGFELSWLQKLPAQLQHRLSVAYTYAENKDSGEALPEIPPFDIRYHLYGNYFKNKLTTEILFRHVLEQKRIADSYGESITPSFSLVDLNVNYLINKNIEINASVINLFDETYYEHLSRNVKASNQAINAPGRNFVLTLMAKF